MLPFMYKRNVLHQANPYFVSYIQRPSWLWQTNSVPLSETAPPWDQFHLITARSARDRKEKTLLRLVHPEAKLTMANE